MDRNKCVYKAFGAECVETNIEIEQIEERRQNTVGKSLV